MSHTPKSARDKILRAADRLFGEVGFDAATTREIAELSGVNKALIHYHFDSKQALLAALLDDYYQRMRIELTAALDLPGTARQRLLRLIDAYHDLLERNRNFSRIVQREASGGKHANRIRELMGPLFELGTQLIKGAFPATHDGELAAEQLMISFYGMIAGYFSYSGMLEPLLGGDPLSAQNLARRRSHLRRMTQMLLDELERISTSEAEDDG
ncbi:MAG: TetR/AcrR family transcriptional regulator [Candidatus Alcyoniella australis]|nr:TetR/AcrR family transcriptional regulator [Candidatus Alcyoniella australis]